MKRRIFICAAICSFTFVSNSLSMENSGIMHVEGALDKSDGSKSDDTSSHGKSKTRSSKKNNEKPKVSTNQLLQENNVLLYALYQQNGIAFQHLLNTQQSQNIQNPYITELIQKTEAASNNLSQVTNKKLKKIHENKIS